MNKLFTAAIFFLSLTSVQAQCPNGGNPSGPELVMNGDFSSGYNGFSSAYTQCPGNCMTEGTYTVCSNPQVANGAFQGVDHTTGTGDFLAVNGNTVANTSVWCQTISIQPNTDYVFSAWVCSLVNWNPAQLQFSINGNPLGPVVTAPANTMQWLQFSIGWNSGNNSTANICIVNQNTQPSGNDFGIDDISFRACCVIPPSQSYDTTVCAGTSVNLQMSSGTSYLWSTGDTVSSIMVNADTPMVYTVTVANGTCFRVDTVTVGVTALPQVVTAGGSEVCLGTEVQVSASGGNSYSWSTGQTGANISVTPTANTTYTVNVSNGMCNSSGTVSVQVNDAGLSSMYVPNVFTPNADGLNELFKVGSYGLDEFRGEIFNRWGDLIFRWENAEGGWDGRCGGKEAPEGVYVFVIHAKNECGNEMTRTGHVTLLR